MLAKICTFEQGGQDQGSGFGVQGSGSRLFDFNYRGTILSGLIVFPGRERERGRERKRWREREEEREGERENSRKSAKEREKERERERERGGETRERERE